MKCLGYLKVGCSSLSMLYGAVGGVEIWDSGVGRHGEGSESMTEEMPLECRFVRMKRRDDRSESTREAPWSKRVPADNGS